MLRVPRFSWTQPTLDLQGQAEDVKTQQNAIMDRLESKEALKQRREEKAAIDSADDKSATRTAVGIAVHRTGKERNNSVTKKIVSTPRQY